MTSSPSLYTTGTDHYKGTPKNGMGIACSRNTFCIFEAGIFHEPQDGLLLGPCPCQLRLLLTDLKQPGGQLVGRGGLHRPHRHQQGPGPGIKKRAAQAADGLAAASVSGTGVACAEHHR